MHTDNYIINKVENFGQLFSIKELAGALQHVTQKEVLTELISKINAIDCTIAMFTTDCKYEYCLYTKQNSLEAIKYMFGDMSFSMTGHNAVSECAKTLKNQLVRGQAHSLETLKECTAYGVPFFSKTGDMEGILYTVSHTETFSDNHISIANTLAAILSENPVFNKFIGFIYEHIRVLEQMCELSSDGFVFIDIHGTLHTYNENTINCLEIDGRAPNVKNLILDKILAINLDLNKSCENKVCVIDSRNGQKSIIVNIDIIATARMKVGTLISFKDSSTDYKWKDSVKGNKAEYCFDNLIGESDLMKTLKKKAIIASKHDCNILIYGESGSGKEVLAQSIHNESNRRNRPFVAINCGALSSELIESELFGYDSGSFTGALANGKIGKMEYASGGTVFLDEIESMPLSTQIKLLRVISNNKITRVGGIDEIPIDIRIISASKANLIEASNQSSFRLDLYYRLQIVELRIPPLKARKSDVKYIAYHLLDKLKLKLDIPEISFSDAYLDILSNYSYRGNVRELTNIIERSVIFRARETLLTLDDLDEAIIANAMLNKGIQTKDENTLLERLNDTIFELVLGEEDGNITKTANRLGITRQRLSRKLAKKIGSNNYLE